jgi:hypothetical protein
LCWLVGFVICTKSSSRNPFLGTAQEAENLRTLSSILALRQVRSMSGRLPPTEWSQSDLHLLSDKLHNQADLLPLRSA